MPLLHYVSHAVIAAALATGSPPAVPAGPAADMARLIGAWDCAGATAGSSSTHQYGRVDDGTFALHAVVHTSYGVTGDVVETFAYDNRSGTWTLDATRNRFFESLRLTAKAPSAREWSFSGRQSAQGQTRDVRIVYTFVGPDEFVREHQSFIDGRRLVDGSLTCRRVAAAALRPSPAARTSPSPSASPARSAAASPAQHVAPSATPSARPSPRSSQRASAQMQQANAVVPRQTGAPAPRASGTPLPIPGIIPAEAPNAPPSPGHGAAAAAARVAQVSPVQPSAARTAPARAPNGAARPSPQATARPSPQATARATSDAPASPRPTASPRPSPNASVRPLANASSRPSPTASSRTAPDAASRPSPQVVAAAGAGADRADRAYRLTGAAWSCETLGGLPATHAYVLQSDGTISLHNVLTIAKHDYAIDETYRFDRGKNVWTTSTGAGAYTGAAPRWLHDKWTFAGTMPAGKGRVSVQMIYSSLGDNAFRRDFVKLQDGSAKTFAAETCHR